MSAGKSRPGWRDALAQAPARARILVVDDEPDIRRSLLRLVTRFGYTAKSAGSAEEADRWLNEEHFDLLMLDIELPRMKGVEFLAVPCARAGLHRLGFTINCGQMWTFADRCGRFLWDLP